MSQGPYRTPPARPVERCEFCGTAVRTLGTYWASGRQFYCDAFCHREYLKLRGIGHEAIAELEETG
jgi:hypothetical protein